MIQLRPLPCHITQVHRSTRPFEVCRYSWTQIAACTVRRPMSGICRHPRTPQALALAGMPRGHGVSATAAVQRRPLPDHACQMARDAPRVSGQTSYRRSTGLRSFQITCRLDLSAPRHASRRPSRGRPEPWKHSTCQNLTPYQRCSNATHPLHFKMDSTEETNGCFPQGSCSRTRRDKLRIPPPCPHAHRSALPDSASADTLNTPACHQDGYTSHK